MKVEGFDVFPSKSKNKKYDVYKDNKKVLSFGQKGYEHYYDKLGHYNGLDHLDKYRRYKYKQRFNKLIQENDKYKPTYWSNRFLWS